MDIVTIPQLHGKRAMVGYSGTPLWKKLGYRAGTLACVDGEPKNYRSLLGLPSDIEVTWLSRVKPGVEFVHLFTTSATELKAKLKSYRIKIAPAGMIWISWPKKSSGMKSDITEDTIRGFGPADGTGRHQGLRGQRSLVGIEVSDSKRDARVDSFTGDRHPCLSRSAGILPAVQSDATSWKLIGRVRLEA